MGDPGVEGPNAEQQALWRWVAAGGGQVTDAATAAERQLSLDEAREALFALMHGRPCHLRVLDDGQIQFRFDAENDAEAARALLDREDRWARAQAERVAWGARWDRWLGRLLPALGGLAYWWHGTFEEAYELTWCRSRVAACLRAGAERGQPELMDFVLSGVLSGLGMLMVLLAAVALTVAAAPIASAVAPVIRAFVVGVGDALLSGAGPARLPLHAPGDGRPDDDRPRAVGPFEPVARAHVGWDHATMEDVWALVALGEGEISAEALAAVTGWDADKVDAALTTVLVHGDGDVQVTEAGEIRYLVSTYRERKQVTMRFAWERLLVGAGDVAASVGPVVDGWCRALAPSLAVALCWWAFPFAEADAHVAAPRWMPWWLWLAGASAGLSALVALVRLISLRRAHGALLATAWRAALLREAVAEGRVELTEAPTTMLAAFVAQHDGASIDGGFAFPQLRRVADIISRTPSASGRGEKPRSRSAAPQS